MLGSAVADANGKWSITTTTLAAGTHVLTATAADSDGDTPVSSATLSLTIVPVPAAPSTPVLAPASDSGFLGGNVTDVATPVITGTAMPATR